MRRTLHGLYAITPDEPDTAILAEKVRQALLGGVSVVQYRNKTADASLRHKQANTLLQLCREARVPLIVNDTLTLACDIAAEGLHLGDKDGDLPAARAQLGGNKLLGASCYNRIDLALVAQAAGADYVAFGAAFPSRTKSAAVHAPLALFREARQRLDIPIVAIGGITPENALSLIDAGVDAIAVISALFDAHDIEATARHFSNLFRQPVHHE